MELIGKKITRVSAFEKSTKSTITVGKGKLKFSGAAMRKIGLFKKEIGIGYDGGTVFLYVEDEGAGNKVHDNGSCNTSYHSKALLELFGSDVTETLTLDLSTEAVTFPQFEGKNFYAITYTPVEEVEEPIAVRSESGDDLYTEYEDVTEEETETEFNGPNVGQL
jgi:hypothetical protein